MDSLFPLILQNATVQRKAKRLLGPIDLQVDAHGITAILGPNGAGKTTLLRVMHGIERLSDGSAKWNIPETSARALQAFVFQTPTMLRRTVAENLAYPLQLRGTARATIEAETRYWAKQIGLSDAMKMPAARLSGGEKQKLAVARALIVNPQILFLDEPCANLDGHSTHEIEALLLAAREKGTRIIIATHNIGQAKRLATDVIFLHDGQLNETGNAPEVFETPKTPALRGFLQGDIIR